MHRPGEYVLTLSCRDTKGTVHAVSAALFHAGCNSVDSQRFGDVSSLPGFEGARPCEQSHDRGVKLIGAAAQCVTADLDEGPIIEQGLARVVHSLQPEDFAAVGRDVESVVLARAVRWHVEHRVLMNGHKTVVFQ